MNRRSLHPYQLELLNLIEELGFGRIERIRICDGKPWFEKVPEIIQEIKLGSDPEPRSQRCNDDHTLKNEFERLFDQLNRLGDGIVDVEVRHSLPFKLAVTRGREELLA
jgi:hypothetical protein